jgi:hypothetical protein
MKGPDQSLCSESPPFDFSLRYNHLIGKVIPFFKFLSIQMENEADHDFMRLAGLSLSESP